MRMYFPLTRRPQRCAAAYSLDPARASRSRFRGLVLVLVEADQWLRRYGLVVGYVVGIWLWLWWLWWWEREVVLGEGGGRVLEATGVLECAGLH